jgi:hypothetical protein
VITYEWRGHTSSKDVMRVKLDRKIVGVIRIVEGGYAYFPKGSKEGGEVFKSVREVQLDLEGEKESSQ